VLWIVALISLAAAGFGTFLLTFVTLPKWVDERLIRLAMTAAVLVIPALGGLVSLRMLEPGARPRGAAAKVATVMRGYPYTVGLAITLVMMTVFEKAQALDVPYDEWEVLFREALLAETALLRGRMPSAARAA
jgi:predicted Abi (CAAX) family protease